jgi:cell wall assembly regulator SMI1
MKRRMSLESIAALGMESFDSAPTGNVQPTMQGATPEQPLVTSGYSESPFSGSENYAAEKLAQRVKEAIEKPLFPVRYASEAEAIVVDDDEFDALIKSSTAATAVWDDNSEVSLEAKDSNKLAVAKNKLHGRFKKMFEGWKDGWRTMPGLIKKYEARLAELQKQLDGTIIRGPLDVNLSGLWQHFSNDAGPIHNNFMHKVQEDLAFSSYILGDFSKEAMAQLRKLESALHTGQGNSDEEAKRTALDLEKLEAPSMYLDHKWMCVSGEQPYLSVTGIYANQGRVPRPVAIGGVSMDKLAKMAMPFHVREYGSFMHGMKKLFVNGSKANVRLTENDLENLIKAGQTYLENARGYMDNYHNSWPIFRRIDESLEMIWNDFDLTDYSITLGDENDEDALEISWQTSGTGDVTRRAALYDQILMVVQNFSDSVVAPGSHEAHRAVRAAKFHCYLLEAALKAVKSAAMESMMVPARLERKLAQEIFGFGKKPHTPAQYQEPEYAKIPKPQWDPKHPPSITESVKTLRAAMQQHDPEGLKTFHRPATPQELQALSALVKQHTGKDLPPDYVELYKISNGGISAYRHLKLLDHDEFIPIHEVIAEYKQRLAFIKRDWAGQKSKCYAGVQGENWWEPWWVPFSASGSGDGYCVDVNPGSGGTFGQVVDWGHDFNDRGTRAPSLAAFVALSIYRQLYLLQHKKDWEAKNGPAPKEEEDEDDDLDF